MKTNRLRLLSIPLVALTLACHDAGDVTAPPDTIPPGAMAYTGYDEHGVPVVQGWVELDIAIIAVGPSTPVNVTGTWELRRVGGGGDVGPQVGTGALEGLLQDDRLWVDFNAPHADNNVFAEGAFKVIGGPASGMSWEGAWIWSDLTGMRRSGTFRARG